MKMTAYTANFSTAAIKRNSERAYAFAWAILSDDGSVYKSGFSVDRANAEKAAASEMPRFVSARDRKHPGVRRHHAKMAKEQGFANADALIAHWDQETAAKRATLKIEIVSLA
jgi:hypothetical protein